MNGPSCRLGACLLAAALTSAALAEAAGPSLTAPSKAAVGDTVTASAAHLHRGRYALRLYATKAPDRNWACAATLATARTASTAVSLHGRIPRRLGCWSGFPSRREGSIRVVPGAYRLVVSVPSGPITTAAGSSVATRRLTVTP